MARVRRPSRTTGSPLGRRGRTARGGGGRRGAAADWRPMPVGRGRGGRSRGREGDVEGDTSGRSTTWGGATSPSPLGLGSPPPGARPSGPQPPGAPSGSLRPRPAGSGWLTGGPGPGLTRASPTTTARRLPTTRRPETHMVDRRTAGCPAAAGGGLEEPERWAPGSGTARDGARYGTAGAAAAARPAGPSGHFAVGRRRDRPDDGQAFDDPEAGGLGPAVARHLVLGGSTGALGPPGGTAGRRHRRREGRAGRWQSSVAARVKMRLDQAVLARVVGDDHAPAAGSRAGRGRRRGPSPAGRAPR